MEKHKQRITYKAGKERARVLQKWVAERISILLNIPCGKDELIASREMGQSGCDVRLIGEALKGFPYSVECKNVEQWNVPDAIKQAKSNVIPGTTWLVFMKKNNIKPVVIMDGEYFFELLSKISK